MIDIHCHILPGLDDGPPTLQDSLEMCRRAAADGISTIVATPHYVPGRIAWTGEKITERIQALSEAVRAEGIPLTLLQGADISIFPELPSHPGLRTFLSLNNSRYLLLEFPCDMMPPGWEGFLTRLIDGGGVPVITHPERSEWFYRHSDALFTAVKLGALVQVTGMSLLGGFGAEARKFMRFLLKHNLAHVMASDGHAPTVRPPVLSEAVREAASVVGEERARQLVETVPAAMIANRPVRVQAAWEQSSGRGTWIRKLLRRMV